MEAGKVIKVFSSFIPERRISRLKLSFLFLLKKVEDTKKKRENFWR
jgi:hypothetical protein